jgi:hypothetical protein
MVVTSTEEPEILKKIKLYPNPAVSFVSVNLQQMAVKVNSVKLYNATGHNVYTDYTVRGNTEIKVPVNSHAPGVYFLHLATDKGLLIRKVIIKR